VSGGELLQALMNHVECGFSEQMAASFISQILSAVAHLHERGIIHRNICSENILLQKPLQAESEEAPIVKLIDFAGAFIF
jgi:serine/threonine protein kinase